MLPGDWRNKLESLTESRPQVDQGLMGAAFYICNAAAVMTTKLARGVWKKIQL